MEQLIKYCTLPFKKGKSFYFDHVRIFWNEQITYHQGAEWELSYVVKGSGTRVIGNTLEIFSSGEVVLIPPGMPHGWTFSEFDHDETGKIENITVLFQDSFIQKQLRAFTEMIPVAEFFVNQKEAITFQGTTLISLQTTLTAMCSQNDIQQLTTLMAILSNVSSSEEKRIVGINSKQDKATSKLQDVSRYVIHNYQKKIKLDDIAKHLGMNRSAFCSFFKREKGKSFFTFLNEYRIDCACLMLNETSVSVVDICYAVGFEDVPYFNRTFKKYKGKAPKEYRQSIALKASA